MALGVAAKRAEQSASAASGAQPHTASKGAFAAQPRALFSPAKISGAPDALRS